MAVIDGYNITGLFKINGIPVPDPHIGYKFEINTTGVWHRNMEASRAGYVVANMKKAYWPYNGLSEADAKIFTEIIYPVLQSGKDVFEVTTDVVGIGPVTDIYYLGQPWSMDGIGGGIYKTEFRWIQDKGKITL